ncbi:hypothetical protein KC323_g129 [Hortaea werneckii]|nr:hypothetical protein KC323_g129 [Hortaea werneckii]
MFLFAGLRSRNLLGRSLTKDGDFSGEDEEKASEGRSASSSWVSIVGTREKIAPDCDASGRLSVATLAFCPFKNVSGSCRLDCCPSSNGGGGGFGLFHTGPLNLPGLESNPTWVWVKIIFSNCPPSFARQENSTLHRHLAHCHLDDLQDQQSGDS